MKCIVIGAGNAGRPVARILNHTGNSVSITDQKTLEEFPLSVQATLKIMEKEGTELLLGLNSLDDLKKFDRVYLSPTLPENSQIRKDIESNNLDIISNEDVSCVIDDLLKLDIIGVTGTLGKTSTTHIVSEIFKTAGYKVWTCSSRMGNLLSEVIVDGIVKGLNQVNDIAILELPHGTSRLISKVNLKIGIITNIYPDHLDEFDYSMEKYIARKMFIAESSEILISGMQCKEHIEKKRDDAVYYCTQGDCDIIGELENGMLSIVYNVPSRKIKGMFKAPFKLRGYYYENSLAAAAAALAYGLDANSIINGLNKFKGISGHMEYIGNIKGREVHFDAAFVPAGLINTLESFESQDLIVIIDNPDSTNPRDKYEVGKVVGKYAKVMICSGYNETTKKLDMTAADEVVKGAEDSKALKIPVENMVIAGELSIKHSNPGNTILHVGPGAITNYEDVKHKMIIGIENGCKKYE